MKSIIIHELEAFYLRHPELKGIPVSLNQIKDAEEILHTKFDRDYTFFLTSFWRFVCWICHSWIFKRSQYWK